MENMFRECHNLEILNLSSFKTEKVTRMGHMFDQCNSLKYLDISNFYTPLVEDIKNMFYNCYSLTSLDISNFNTAKIRNMKTLFRNCNNLTSLNISSFDTSSVVTMNAMFQDCKKLLNLDLSKFDTSKVTDMSYLFAQCNSLTSLDLRNFETKSVKLMNNLFDNCQSLTSLDLSNFDTSNVNTMNRMFDQCRSLTSLDLTSWNTSLVVDIYNMFYNCENLKFLDVSNFNTKKITKMENAFIYCKKLIFLNLSSFDIYDYTTVRYILGGRDDRLILCYNESKMPNHFLNEVKRFENSCLKVCLMNSKKYILEIEMCVNNCYEETYYKYEYKDICYPKCPIRTQLVPDSTYLCEDCPNYYNYEYTGCIDEIPEGFYKNESLGKTIDKCPNKCKSCSLESLNNNLCILCNENYFPKDNDPLNIDSFYECYNKNDEQLGYYLDNENNIFKPCYNKCKKCDREGDDENNNCIECKDDYDYINENGNCKIKIIETTNIEDKTTINTYRNKESTNNNVEQIDISNTKVLSTETIGRNNIESSYINNEPISNKIENQQKESNIINEISSSFLINNQIENNIINSELYQKSILSNKEISISIYSEKIINIKEKSGFNYSYEINSASEEIKNDYNHTYIHINEETINKLKNIFSIGANKKIFISITENIKNDSHTATMDYIYEYILENGTVLDLNSIEEDIYVDVYVPITDLELAKFNLTKHFAEQGYDIYDINSAFYKDFCTPAYLGDNDITLKDRKKDIYPNNITLCKKNCKYNGINIEEKRVICSCNLNSDKIEENNNILEEDDGNFKSYLLDNINYKIFICYKLFFNVENLKISYPFYIILIICLLVHILDFLYLSYSIRRFKIFMARELFSIQSKNKVMITESKKLNDTKNNKLIENPPKRKSSKTLREKKISEKNLFMNTENDEQKVKNRPSSKFIKFRNKNKFWKEDTKLPSEEKTIKEEKEIIEDFNNLPYTKAIIVDKRNIIQIFFSFIIEKLELVSILLSSSQLRIIFYVEYIIALLFNFFFNALLYSDEVISNKYHNNGKLDFIVSLTLSILSNIITSILFHFIKYSRGIEEKINLILELRYKMHFYRNFKKLLLFLRIKFIFFYISQLIIFGICIYYLVIFCILYTKSRKSLLVNYFYSLIESIITSFAVALIILITRKIGLCCPNKEFYNVSKYINYKF